ncbi:GIY-YIG nuclease family protein [Candidatus Azambacteria bacterium]|nr:GIY-YIG nuclease family protein [Candidatus Azambacteria bacterium]MBI3684882.1 GIY-YIG nuclease family protein [Candidatus Azambacteria bacterium]
MFYIYVLQSKKDKKIYIGYTADLKKRFEEHNSGVVPSTKPRIPFALVYYEAYASQKDAKHRERMLKKFSGSVTHLRKRIMHSVILSK